MVDVISLSPKIVVIYFFAFANICRYSATILPDSLSNKTTFEVEVGWDILSGTGVTTALKIIVHTIVISITLEEKNKHYPLIGTFLGTLQNLMKG